MQDDPTRGDSLFGPLGKADDEDEWIGRSVEGRYRILERLGEGGMGAVFIAEHMQLQKQVALKVIHAHFAGNDEIAARFAREAMTSAHIEHPNVASALDFGMLPEGGAYLVMQLVRGPSLSEYLAQRGALSAAETCQIATQIADAVAAAHAVGVVHRDLKPDNVVLMPNEAGPPTVKVLDFGIAHVKVGADASLDNSKPITRIGVVIGTPGYMPPEQAMGQGVDERADLYALGVMLWELLMGTAPFEGGTFSDIVTRQMQAPAPELKLPPDARVPDPLRMLVSSLLERSPANRPRSAAEVRDKLRMLSIELSPTPSGAPVPQIALAATIRSVRTPPRIAGIANEWRWALAALLLVLLVFVWKLSTGSETAATPAEIENPPPLVASPKRKAETKRTLPSRRVAEAESQAPEAAKPKEEESESATRRAERGGAKSESSDGKSERPRPVQRLRRAINNLLN